MKNTNSTTALSIAKGINHNINAALALALCWLAGTAYLGAQVAPSTGGTPDNLIGPVRPEVAGGTNTVSGAETNSAAAAIAADLQRLKVRIEAAAALMSNAVASTPAMQAARVTKLADEIAELATQGLGEGGQIAKRAEALVAKFNEATTEAQKRSGDPNIRPATRAAYEEMLPKLKAELGKLIEAKASIGQLRTELLRQAEGLRQSADLIGFAEHYQQLVKASAAFRDALAEVGKFTEKVSLLIQGVVKNLSPVPVS